MAKWTVRVGEHAVVVSTTDDGRIAVEVVERRPGQLLRFGQRTRLVADVQMVTDLWRALGSALLVTARADITASPDDAA